MRFTGLFLIALLVFVFAGRSQSVFNASYGIFPSNEISRLDKAKWESDLTSLHGSIGQVTMGFGVLSVGYSTAIGTRGWQLGTTAIFSQTKVDFTSQDLIDLERQSVHTYFYSVLIKVSRVWYTHGSFKLYSTAAGGASYQYAKAHETGLTREKVVPAYHVNAFGVRFGEPVGVLLEVGYGYAGIANFGITVDL